MIWKSRAMKKWLTGVELLQRMEMSISDLIQLIDDGELSVYAPETIVEVECKWVLGGAKVFPSPKSKVKRMDDHLAFFRVEELFFDLDDVETWQSYLNYDLIEEEKRAIHSDPTKQETGPTEQKTTEQGAVLNSFTKNGSFWEVCYEGETKMIRDLDGINYIVTLLRQPGNAMSCQDLFHSLLVNTLETVMTVNDAIGEGLHTGKVRQSIGTGKQRIICLEEYKKLEAELPEVGMEEQEKIKEKMARLRPFLNLKERNFVDPNDKRVQINIGKRLAKAYEAIRKGKMIKLAEHLQKHIKTDNAYGQIYTGSITWNITIK